MAIGRILLFFVLVVSCDIDENDDDNDDVDDDVYSDE